MRIGYADPPYPGMARLYRNHPDFAGEVDHAALIARLCRDFPDGWALHTASTTLKLVIPHCPDDVRIAAWVKPWCSFKPGVGVAYAWEPVILRGGRKRSRGHHSVKDWAAVNATTQRGLKGAKPEGVCFWIFSMLNLEPTDDLVDLFPGTGAVMRAWQRWQRQIRMPEHSAEKQTRMESVA